MIPIYLAGFPEQYGQDTSLNFASLPLKHVFVVVPLPFGLLSRLLPIPSVDSAHGLQLKLSLRQQFFVITVAHWIELYPGWRQLIYRGQYV